MVKYDWGKVPPSTPEEEAVMAALAELPDSEIDITDPDAPPLTDDQLTNMRTSKFRTLAEYPPIHIDADILDWFRKKRGRGYQTHMNGILRDAMNREQLN